MSNVGQVGSSMASMVDAQMSEEPSVLTDLDNQFYDQEQLNKGQTGGGRITPNSTQKVQQWYTMHQGFQHDSGIQSMENSKVFLSIQFLPLSLGPFNCIC